MSGETDKARQEAEANSRRSRSVNNPKGGWAGMAQREGSSPLPSVYPQERQHSAASAEKRDRVHPTSGPYEKRRAGQNRMDSGQIGISSPG